VDNQVKQVSQSLKDGRVEVLDVPKPELRPHGVLVRTAWSLISPGTEGAKVDMGQKSLLGKARSRPDQVRQVVDKVRSDGILRTYRTVKARLEEQGPIGYSSAGVVIGVGELAAGVAVGERVACGGGDYANHAEYAYVPATLCARVPEGVELDEAAFATVGAVAMQGVRQSGVTVGDRAAVVGLGLVGQLTVQLLLAAGCEVAGVDLDEARCRSARDLGAAVVTAATGSVAARELLSATGGVGYDAVLLTAGTKSDEPVALAGEIARDRGTVVVVGDVGMQVPRAPFYEKELTLKLARSYGPGRYDPLYEENAIDYPIGYVRWTEQRNMQEFLRLVAAGRLDVRRLITHRFPVDDAAAAYAAVTDAASGSLGVVLEYPEGKPEKACMDVGRPAAGKPVAGAVGVSLLGAGNFATATLLPALAKDARFTPRGVYTPSGLSACDVAERNGFAFSAESPEELLADAQTTAVVIATRHASHASLVVKALRAGKTVFVEKPLAMTEQELEEVVAAQRETGGTATVGFNRRFAPHVRKMTAALARRSAPANILIRVNAGAIPSTHWIQRPEEGGGRIVGELCHFVDLAACLAGASPTSVFARGAGATSSPLLTDDLTVVLGFADGSVATLVYSSGGDSTYPKERVEVFCMGKVMVSDDFKRLSLTQGGRTHTSRAQQADKGHGAEMVAFLDLAAGKKPEILTFADCVASTAATFKVIESLTTGAVVQVPAVETIA
jgi:predicted dehydrogenase/threonine dehydrogenase-like Zn-dependent dehydrogenase